MDGCENYEDGKRCRYYEALHGTGEEPPSGMDGDTGECLVIMGIDSWIEADPDDCDMMDLGDYINEEV